MDRGVDRSVNQTEQGTHNIFFSPITGHTISLAGSKREYLLAFPITWCGRRGMCGRKLREISMGILVPTPALALTLPKTPDRAPSGSTKEAMSSGETR